MADERFSSEREFIVDSKGNATWRAMPTTQSGHAASDDGTSSNVNGWNVIHRGKEYGPLSLAEMIGMAAVGNIDSDDLVKELGGPWTKASEFAFLQRQFVMRKGGNNVIQEILGRLSRFQGIWLSKKNFVICGCILAALVLLWAINKPGTRQRQSPPRNSLTRTFVSSGFRTEGWLTPDAPFVGQPYALYVNVTNKSSCSMSFTCAITSVPMGDMLRDGASQRVMVAPGATETLRFNFHCGVKGGTVYYEVVDS